MAILDLWFASGESSLSVRRFETVERIFDLFEVSIVALSPDEDIDFETIVGKPAALYIAAGTAHITKDGRRFAGICSHMEQLTPEVTGLSTYRLRIVPALWLLTQRRNHRIFQHLSVPEIVNQILDEWRIEHVWIDTGKKYPKLELRIQYGETDYDFLRRMLEEAGIAFYFRDGNSDGGAELVLHDQPNTGEEREGGGIPYVENPNLSAQQECLMRIHISQEVRPGRVTIRDHDFRRRPEYKLYGQSSAGPSPEHLLEQYRYAPGAFLVEGAKGGETPVADDKGVARHEESAGKSLAERRFEGARASRRAVMFATNLVDLHPGVVFSTTGHPRKDLQPERKLLVTEFRMQGTPMTEWTMEGSAVFAEVSYRPPQVTPKPQIHGVESAIIVGPAGEEIHTDEFARVRVQFHWDRHGDYSDQSSCWVRVSQGWAGSGFGLIAIPRVGQEVLIAFLGGNPDQPVVVGRLFNNMSRVPYKLPENKTISTWKSDSTPGSNGSNEIRFEDARGREQVFMQAERNLDKVVKLDEREKTGRNRLIEVGERIELTTGKASIIIDGPDIIIEAQRDLRLKGNRSIISHGGPLTQINPWVPRLKFGRVKPPQKLPPVPKIPGVVAIEPYLKGISMKGYPEFRDRLRAALDRLNATPTGRSVMKKIARSGQTVTIKETKAPNVYVKPVNAKQAAWEQFGVPGKGSGSEVSFNPGFGSDEQPSELGLGHALISAWHMSEGKQEKGTTGGVDNETLKVVGLQPYSKQRPCENRLRRDMGLPLVNAV